MSLRLRDAPSFGAITRASAREAGAPRVTTRLLLGDVVPELLKLIESSRHDLVVLGAHGRRHALAGLGSVAERLVRRAPCPVLTAKDETTGETPRRSAVHSRQGALASGPGRPSGPTPKLETA